MRPARERARADDDETDEALSLEHELAEVVARADATRLLSLLRTETISRAPSDLDDVAPSLLSRAPATSDYRQGATRTLRQAMGPTRTARAVIDLLLAAGHERDAATLDVLADALDPAVIDRMRREALSHEEPARSAAALTLLGRVAPESVRLSGSDVRRLAQEGDVELARAIPRLALGLSPLDGATRKLASRLLHRLAPRTDSLSSEALAALVRAGAKVHRSFEGTTAIARAAEAGAVENVRILESAGARLDRAALRGPARDAPRAKTPRAKTPRAETPRAETPRSGTARVATPQRGTRPSPSRSLTRAQRRGLVATLGVVLALLASVHPGLGLTLGAIATAWLGVLAARGELQRWWRADDRAAPP